VRQRFTNTPVTQSAPQTNHKLHQLISNNINPKLPTIQQQHAITHFSSSAASQYVVITCHNVNTAEGGPDAVTVDGSVLTVRTASCDKTVRGTDVAILQHNGETSVPELGSFP